MLRVETVLTFGQRRVVIHVGDSEWEQLAPAVRQQVEDRYLALKDAWGKLSHQQRLDDLEAALAESGSKSEALQQKEKELSARLSQCLEDPDAREEIKNQLAMTISQGKAETALAEQLQQRIASVRKDGQGDRTALVDREFDQLKDDVSQAETECLSDCQEAILRLMQVRKMSFEYGQQLHVLRRKLHDGQLVDAGSI